jgi:PhnB protein
MASRLNPYINVPDGKAREAMEFYQSVLGGELNVMTFGDMGADGDIAGQVMHAQLETPAGFTLMGADAPEGMTQVTYGDNISVSLSGDDTDELTGYFTGLAEGGSITTPLERQVWGDVFGQVVDKFGVSWLVNIAGEGNQA